MGKISIIDGNNFFRRTFYHGYVEDNFSASLLGVLRPFLQFKNGSLKDSQVIMTFDTCKSEKRLALYPDYKGHRKSSLTEKQLEMYGKVFPAFIAICRNMKLRVLEGDGYEADDYIAMLSFMLCNRHLVKIYSTDGDFPQLVSRNISVYSPNKNIEITSINFQQVFGISQEFYLDMKCMCGDDSDNIPGINGVGEKTAMKYINEYGSYTDICNALKEKKKLTKTDEKFLNFDAKQMELNRQLMDLSLVKNDKQLQELVKKKVKAVLEIDTNDLFALLCEYGISEVYDQCKP